MTKSDYSLKSKTVFDLSRFSKDVLESPERLLESQAYLQNALYNVDFPQILSALSSIDSLLEYLITVDYEDQIQNILFAKFPANHCDDTVDLYSKLMSALSKSLISMTSMELSTEVLDRYYMKVQQKLLIIHELRGATFAESRSEDEPQLKSFVAKKKLSQAEKKRAMRTSRSSNLDPRPFEQGGFAVPRFQEEAEKIGEDVMSDLKKILQYYTLLLKKESYIAAARNQYFATPVNTILPEEKDDECSDEDLHAETDAKANLPAIPETVSHNIQASLYHEIADGFGHWPILVESNAITKLRVLAKRDPKNYDILIKKLKQLSEGHFSRDNQKRLKGDEMGIPIYEAKMARDMRLIYQVHCIPQEGIEGERQALRVFGVYTHAQMDQRLWESLSCQLVSFQGLEYRKRCLARQSIPNGPDMYMPMSWPTPVPVSTQNQRDLIGVPQNDIEELHRLLVLEKYIPISQDLIKSIISDKDVSHAFVLSSEEQAIMRHPSSCYVIGRSGTGKTVTMMFKMLALQKSFQISNDETPLRQLFVTKSEVLTDRVHRYFSKLMDSYGFTSPGSTDESRVPYDSDKTSRRPLLNYAEEERLRSGLPAKFSELSDRYFPLFITFDQLCSLLEADLMVPASATHGADEYISSIYLERIFEKEFWAHFAQDLTKDVEPKSVFSEILGVIEGSELALQTERGYLDLEAYINLSGRSFPNFVSSRKKVYMLFEAFLKSKRSQSIVDCANRAHSLLKALTVKGVPGIKIDYLYVDEIQDHLISEALVLRMLCKNAKGLFWAGDTAQTIFAGSSFKFNELKSTMYRAEKQNFEENMESYSNPPLFQLSVNYRSHDGIVKCASSIVNILTKIWPYTIDKLVSERGVVDGGAKPVFFGGNESNWKDELDGMVLLGRPETALEFGAGQCIIVRDRSAYERLYNHFGENANILTVYDSKGLEFDEVLLYNFFDDSPVDSSGWRVITKSLKDDKYCKTMAPSYTAVCRELKFLYVAITRARKKLWIVDHSKKATVMKKLWEEQDLVQISTSRNGIASFAVASNKEECESAAQNFFDQARYNLAARWFKHAGLDTEAAISGAYQLREEAKSKVGTDRDLTFVRAGEAFAKVAAASSKALQGYKAYHRLSGQCFASGKCHEDSARQYYLADEFTHAALEFAEARLFDEIVTVIQEHEKDVEQDAKENLLNMCKYFYIQNCQIAKAQRLSDSPQGLMDFAEDRDLDSTALLEYYGHHTEAAENHLDEGRVEYIMSLTRNEIAHISSQTILRSLWQLSTMGAATPLESAKFNLKVFFDTIYGAHQLWSEKDMNELKVLNAFLLGASRESCKQLGKEALQYRNKAAYILSMDSFFSDMSPLTTEIADSALHLLEDFRAYVQVYRGLLLKGGFDGSEELTKLIGIHIGDNYQVKVWKSSVIYSRIQEFYTTSLKIADNYVSLPAQSLNSLICEFLIEHFGHRVDDETKAFMKMRVRTPCRNYLNRAKCENMHSDNGCAYDHLLKIDLNTVWYISRMKLYLQQIAILQGLDSVLKRRKQTRQRRDFLLQFFEIFNPEFHGYGSCVYLQSLLSNEELRPLSYSIEWLKDLYLSATQYIGHDPSRFLQDFLVYSLFASNLSDEIATSVALQFFSVAHRKLYRWNITPVVQDLRAFFDPKTRSIHGGICFLSHILRMRLLIDANVVTHLIERICGALAMACKSRFHNLTLPTSWLLLLLRPGISPQYIEPFFINDFLSAIGIFVDTLLLPYGSHDNFLQRRTMFLESQSLVYKRSFVYRTHTALCLWAYNTSDKSLKQRIFDIISSAYQSRFENRISIRTTYTNARGWEDLAFSVRHAFDDLPLERLVCLKLERKTSINQLKHIPGITIVLYKKYDEIEGLLISLLKSPQTSEAIAKAPLDISNHTDRNILDSKSSLVSANRFDVVQVDSFQDQDATIEDAEDDNEPHQFTSNEFDGILPSDRVDELPSSEKLEAVCVIQRSYRKRLNSQNPPESSVLAEKRWRIFQECLRNISKLKGCNTLFRRIFLGALPHALLCLDAMQSRAQKEKEKRKFALPRASPEQHRDLDRELTTFNRIRKAAIAFQKQLQPTSNFHGEANIGWIQKTFLGLTLLAQDFDDSTLIDVSWDLDMVKAVIRYLECSSNLEKPCSSDV